MDMTTLDYNNENQPNYLTINKATEYAEDIVNELYLKEIINHGKVKPLISRLSKVILPLMSKYNLAKHDKVIHNAGKLWEYGKVDTLIDFINDKRKEVIHTTNDDKTPLQLFMEKTREGKSQELYEAHVSKSPIPNYIKQIMEALPNGEYKQYLISLKEQTIKQQSNNFNKLNDVDKLNQVKFSTALGMVLFAWEQDYINSLDDKAKEKIEVIKTYSQSLSSEEEKIRYARYIESKKTLIGEVLKAS